MPHCTSWNQILIKTFVIIKFGELKQRVIASDGDPTFTLDNKRQEKDDNCRNLGKRGKWLAIDGDIGWLDGAIG
jgi:hypothetical protein